MSSNTRAPVALPSAHTDSFEYGVEVPIPKLVPSKVNVVVAVRAVPPVFVYITPCAV